MQRCRSGGCTVAQSKINSNLKPNFTATENIVQEGFLFLDDDVGNFEFTCIEHDVLLICKFLELIKLSLLLIHFLVVSSLIILEDLNHHVRFRISFGQSICISEDTVPLKHTLGSLLALTLIDRLELILPDRSLLVDYDEVTSAI